MLKRVDHIAITVTDLETSIEFYRQALGFELVARWGPPVPGPLGIAFMELGGTRIELISPERPPLEENTEEGKGLRHLCLSTDDMEGDARRLTSLGVRFVREPYTIGGDDFKEIVACADYPIREGFRRAVVEDPDGVMIELLEVKK